MSKVESRFEIDKAGIVRAYRTPLGNLSETLPPLTYEVVSSQEDGLLLKQRENFKLPDELFGNLVAQRTSRILKTYGARRANLGVALTGNKGTGKSLQLRFLAETARVELGIPVIQVSSYVNGAALAQFLNSFTQDAVIVFDEFDKVYNRPESVNTLLPLFDGLYASRYLFVLTSNCSYLHEYLSSRPGRVYYAHKYGKLDESEVKDFLGKKLKTKEFFNDILKLYGSCRVFGYDILKTVVGECNMYSDLKFDDIVAPLNIGDIPEVVYGVVSVFFNGKRVGAPSRINLRRSAERNDFSYYGECSIGTLEETQNFLRAVASLCSKYKGAASGWLYELCCNVDDFAVDITNGAEDDLDAELDGILQGIINDPDRPNTDHPAAKTAKMKTRNIRLIPTRLLAEHLTPGGARLEADNLVIEFKPLDSMF